jgi:hypothetical protein
MSYTGKFEFAAERRYRERNTRLYRLAHWPIWIWVFFLAPGPLTFQHVLPWFPLDQLGWLAAVLIGTGIAGLRGRLPGVEPCPYILRFDEDRPNPLYRRVCYTFAWNAVLSFTLLNLTGLVLASATGVWHLKQIYYYAYSPLCASSCCSASWASCPASVRRPKAKASSAATSMARSGPPPLPTSSSSFSGVSCRKRPGNFAKLVVFGAVLAALAWPPRAASCLARVPSYLASSWPRTNARRVGERKEQGPPGT